MDSIIQEYKECFVCETPYNLHCHHIFFGVANRKISEKLGFKVWLCQEHHTGRNGVHFNKDLDKYLKGLAQTEYEERYGSRSEFIGTFGKSYL